MKNNNKKITNVPNLRFPEFKDKLSKTKLEDLTNSNYRAFAGGPFGSNLKSCDYTKSGIPVIQLSNITEENLDFSKRIIFTSNEKADELIACNAFPNEIIIAKMMPAGRACISTNEYPRYVLGSDGIRVSIDSNKGNLMFIKSQINSLRIKTYITERTTGSTRKRIGIPELKSLPLFVPSINEQNKIGEFLSKIEKRITIQIKIISKIKSLRNALIYKLEDSNEKIPLSTFGSLKHGYPFKSNSYLSAGKYLVVTIKNVTGDKYIKEFGNYLQTIPHDIQKHQILNENDILISLTGNVGRVSLNKTKGCLLNQRVGCFKINNIGERDFVYCCLSSQKFEKAMIEKGQGAAQLNISKKDVESYLIPKITDSSSNIVKILNKIDEKLKVETSVLLSYQKMKTYLLSNLFI